METKRDAKVRQHIYIPDHSQTNKESTMAKDILNDHAQSNNPTAETPKIYVVCLAAYSAHKPHGKWIDSTQEVEIIHKEIKQMLSESPIEGVEEFAIHDFEGFGSLRLDKYESIEIVHEKAMFILERGEQGAELLAYYGDIESAQDALENRYHGEHENALEFAIQLFDDVFMDSIPVPVQGYIDYASYKRDLFMSDFFSIEVGGKTHVFARR